MVKENQILYKTTYIHGEKNSQGNIHYTKIM